MHRCQSHNNVTIRLPSERWGHITQNHPELAGYLYNVLETIENPDEIRSGNAGALIATRSIESGKVLVVVYKEVSHDDGFVITAFLTRELKWLSKKSKLWP